jgi:hypothetical protein
MIRIILPAVILFSFLAPPAFAQDKDEYEVHISSPVGAKGVTFEDEFLIISFPRQTHLTLTIVNKIKQSVEIDWRKASFVDISGKSHRVIYNDLRNLDQLDTLPPTVVPLTGVTYYTVVPAGFVSHEANSESWGVRDLYAGGMEAYVNKPFSLRLPIKIGAETKEYVFTFVVEKKNAK